MNENEIVDLSHTKLSEIPTIAHSTVKLSLRRNLIGKMKFSYLPNLQDLDMSDNKIKKIEHLENLPNLKSLDLSYNLITEIHIPTCKLRELYLICNDILKIENINIESLEILDLAVNDISKIENLEKCINITELYLGSNKITEIPDLSYLKNLKILDLQNNLLTKIDCFKLPKTITQLLLSENENLYEISNIDLLLDLNLLAIKKTKITEVNKANIEIWK